LLSAEQLGPVPRPEDLVRLGVVGWPVAHSRSPAIHNAALAATGHTGWRYQLLPVPPELFAETVPALAEAGFRGVNVTIPHKAAALGLATDASPRAAAIGAANTLVFGPEGQIAADNTDATALIDALRRPVHGATAFILGAGGSARAALWALIDAGAAAVWVWNRTPERAQTLCDELGGEPTRAAVPADVLINCTAVGLDG
jgi:shikimate dehydrogenase